MVTRQTVLLPSGLKMQCRFAGDPSQPPMLLLHALGESGADWDSVVPVLSARYRLVMPDLRGHGDSEWPGQYSFELMRDDVAALLDHLGTQRTVVVGHSMGAVVAWVLAQTVPQRISRLVIEDAPPPFPRETPVRDRPPGELPFDWDVIVQVAEQVNDPTRRWWPGLRSLPMPVLIIAGGPSSSIPQAEIAAAASAVPDASLLTLDTGHHVHRGKPDEWAEAVLGWLHERSNS